MKTTIETVDKAGLVAAIADAESYCASIKGSYGDIEATLKAAIAAAAEVAGNDKADTLATAKAEAKVSVAKAVAARQVAEAKAKAADEKAAAAEAARKAAEEKAAQAAEDAFGPLAQVKLGKIKGAKKKMTVWWSAVSGAKGYQVVVAKNKKGTKDAKTYTVKGASKVKKVIKKLKKGKYFVKVAAYSTYKGNDVFGKFSKVKAVKVK